MENNQYKFSIMGFSIYGGLVAATTAAVLALYGYVHGFDILGENLRGASMAMTAAFNQPAQQPMQNHFMGQQPFQQQPVYQGQGQMMYQPQVMQQQLPAGQYICPQHGSVGTPTIDGMGTPRCPLDGQAMQFNNGGTGFLR